jgi:hypothetical protein
VTAKFSAEFLHKEQARFYAYGRFDSSSLEFVPSEVFADTVMDLGTTVAQFPVLYNRLAKARSESLAQARAAEAREAA